jgi:hypothetical protein
MRCRTTAILCRETCLATTDCCRDDFVVPQILETIRDLRHGFRTLLKRPAFSAVALVTLALGIGANTAMFSIINTVLLNGLPYPASNQLVILDENRLNSSRTVSWMDFLDARLTIWRLIGFLMSISPMLANPRFFVLERFLPRFSKCSAYNRLVAVHLTKKRIPQARTRSW